jgi:hypothetical protein
MSKKRIKMIFPVPMSEATRPLVESRLPPSMQRPDIEVEFLDAGQVMTLADLGRHLNVPVLNPGVVAYKYCEMLLDLGLCHSKIAFPSPETYKDAAFGL